MTQDITITYMMEVVRKEIGDIGIVTNNFKIFNILEQNIASGNEKLIQEAVKAIQQLGWLKGSLKLKFSDFKDLLEVNCHTDYLYGNETHVLNVTPEVLQKSVALLEKADATDLNTLLVVAQLGQDLGRYSQEYGIDAAKTFVLPEEIIDADEMKKVRSAMKEVKEIKIDWDAKTVMNNASEDIDNEKTNYVESLMSQTRDEAMILVQEEVKDLAEKVQKLDKVRSYLGSGKVKINQLAIDIVKWMQGDFMTISYASRKEKQFLSKLMDGNLDKVARNMLREKFDPYFMGQRNLLRNMLCNVGCKNEKAALMALQAAIENIDSKKEDMDENKSEMISSLVEKLLKEEFSLLTLGSKHIAKEKLILCDIEEGTKVEFTNHYTVSDGKAAYGVNIPDGIYTIAKEINESGKEVFFATKVVKEHMLEQLEEQNTISDITVYIKKIFFPMEQILKRVSEEGVKVELKPYHNDRYNGRTYDAIVINGVAVGKFDCPLKDEWTVKTKDLVRKAFFGKWNVKCGNTFACSNGSTKSFLVLSK